MEDIRLVTAVWMKGKIIVNYDPNVWRYDDFGSPICWSHYGNRNSKHGWEIDHIIPVDRGGSNVVGNLRPLQWQNNAKKSNNIY